MADLTAQLNTDFRDKPVRDTSGGGDTSLATGLNDINRGVEVFDRSQKSNAAAAMRAKEMQDKVDSQHASLATAQTMMGIQDPSTRQGQMVFAPEQANVPVDPALAGQLGDTRNRLANVNTAVLQGTMPGISYEAQKNKAVQSLMARFPNQTEVIFKFMRENGINASMFRPDKDEASAHDNLISSNQKFEDEMFTKGAAALDPKLMATSSRADVIAAGMNANHTEYTLDQTSKAATLALSNQNLTDAQRKQAETNRDETIGKTVITDAYNNSGPITTALQQLMIGIGKAPAAQQQGAFERLGPQFDQWAGNYKARAIAQATQAGYSPDKLATLGASVDTMITRARTMWSGDFSMAKANQAALQSVATGLKLDVSKAMPVFFALQDMGMKSQEIDTAMSAALGANPTLLKSLQSEVKGFTGEFGQENASTHLMNIVRVLKGQAKLRDYTSGQAREAMPGLYAATRGLTQQYANGQAGIGTDTVLNGVGEIVTAARSLDATSGLAAWQKASLGATSAATRLALIKALKDPDYNNMAEATITGSRAASSKLLQSMNGSIGSMSENGWSITRKDGRLVGSYSGPATQTFRPDRGPMVTVGQMSMPTQMQRFIDTYNGNIDNLVELNKYDPLGNKKATPLQITHFYAEGKMSEPYQAKPAKQIDPNSEIGKGISAVEQAFAKVPDMNAPIDTSSPVAGTLAAEGTGKNPRSSAVGPGQFVNKTFREQMAKAHPDVALPADSAGLIPFKQQYGKELTQNYANENAGRLTQAGVPVTKGTVYLAHFAGPMDAIKLLKSDPSQPVKNVISPASYAANPHLHGMSVGDTIAWASKAVNRKS